MVAPRARPPLLALVDELLAEQNRLQTPVAQASQFHDQIINHKSEIVNFQRLIPLTAPAPGEQYAFEVDLDSCSGCKACVSACHSLNGLDETESWRDVGLVHGGTCSAPFQQTITTACHHCADPACLNGCPVLAYEKDPVTGIVRHLDDQCIGCQYCVLKCPYDVPKYSERLGIVRKCDMCHQRLGVGEAPACAQACPTQAIKIVKVSLTTTSRLADTSAFLSVAPDPAYTQPTTRYVSARRLPENLVAADAALLVPQPPHWPLVFMLTLLPMAVGSFTLATIFTLTHQPFSTPAITHLAWLAGALGLGASVFHLGQPWRAWRIFLGWRTSWLSREAMAFGAWFAAATLTTVLANGWLDAPVSLPLALVTTTLIGLAGLYCSVMIYVDTRREFWRRANTSLRFFGSTLILGLVGTLATSPATPPISWALAAATFLKLAGEARALATMQEPDDGLYPPARQTARLLTGPLRSANELRITLGVLGGILLPATIALTSPSPAWIAWLSLGLCVGGELTERYLYFRAVVAPKMPGAIR